MKWRTRSPAVITAMPTNWQRWTAVQLALLAYSANTALWATAVHSLAAMDSKVGEQGGVPDRSQDASEGMQVIGSVGKFRDERACQVQGLKGYLMGRGMGPGILRRPAHWCGC